MAYANTNSNCEKALNGGDRKSNITQHYVCFLDFCTCYVLDQPYIHMRHAVHVAYAMLQGTNAQLHKQTNKQTNKQTKQTVKQTNKQPNKHALTVRIQAIGLRRFIIGFTNRLHVRFTLVSSLHLFQNQACNACSPLLHWLHTGVTLELHPFYIVLDKF